MPQIRKNTLQDAKSYGIIVWLITAQGKCSGIEVVITGLTRNLLPLEPPKISNPLCFKHSPGFIEVHIFACSILFFYPIPDLVFFKDLG